MRQVQERIRTAVAERRPLELVGHGSKRFYGETPQGQPWLLSEEAALKGVRAFEPSELYVTVGAATPLTELEALLAQAGQQLAC